MDSARAETAITRRRFTMLAAGGLGALALPGCTRSTGASPLPPAGLLRRANGPSELVHLAGVPRSAGAGGTASAVRAVAEAATDFAWLSRGDTVLVKVACNSGNAYPATTDPVAVHALVRLLREKGAGRVLVGDMSGVQFVRFGPDELSGSTRALMERNGLARAASEAGAELHPFEEAGWDAFFPERPEAPGAWTGPLWLPAVLRETDHVVLMPRCARHLLAGSTLGLKAAVGWWRHDSRLEYHRDASTFSEKTADARHVPALRDRQRLVLSSATRILTTFGPDEGHVLEPDTGLVMASRDVVAHDMVSLAWLLESRDATPTDLRDGLFEDPNRSQRFVSFANRVVTHWLGGFREMLRTEQLARYDLDRVWDDRVLRRAFETAGGVPPVALAPAGGSLPPALRERLAARLTLPAAA
jgi:uncharacterized protein (DUF362 family)